MRTFARQLPGILCSRNKSAYPEFHPAKTTQKNAPSGFGCFKEWFQDTRSKRVQAGNLKGDVPFEMKTKYLERAGPWNQTPSFHLKAVFCYFVKLKMKQERDLWPCKIISVNKSSIPGNRETWPFPLQSLHTRLTMYYITIWAATWPNQQSHCWIGGAVKWAATRQN